MPADTPVQAPRHRVRVFVDFWNYTLSMRDADAEFRTDWAKLGPVLARAAAAAVDAAAAGEYQGLNFYGSQRPSPRRGPTASPMGDDGGGHVSRRKRVDRATPAEALAARMPRLPQRGRPMPRLRR